MTITHRSTETIDHYDVDVILPAIPFRLEPTLRVSHARVEISPAVEAELGLEEPLPAGSLYVDVTVWGRPIKAGGTPDKRYQQQTVKCWYDEQQRYELERELIRVSLKRHKLSESLVVSHNMRSWEAYTHASRQA